MQRNNHWSWVILPWFLLFFLSRTQAQSGVFVELVSDDPALGNPLTIESDGGLLFVVNFISDGNNEIVSLPASGGAVWPLQAGLRSPFGMAVIGDDLFWIDPNSGPITDTRILRVPKLGGLSQAIYTGSAVGQPVVDGSGLTTDGTMLFTVDEVQGRVHRLGPDGSDLTLIGVRFGGFFNTERFQQIDHRDGILYISDAGRSGVAPPGVFSIPVGGGSFSTLHEGAPLICPTAVSVGDGDAFLSGGDVYVSDPCANTIWSLPVTGGPPTALVSGAPFVNVWGLAFDDDERALYATDTGNAGGFDGRGAIYRISSQRVVVLDIKPESRDNPVNPGSLGVLPAAVLSTADFDASLVNSSTVRFGATASEAAPVHVHLEDVNGDLRLDLILLFRTKDTGIQCGDTSAALTGRTFAGLRIVGEDFITTVGCKDAEP